ncbi:DUF7507 domain-containing protein [Microbacterium timonense]|uniref:DUF7507 domain-containing protein n=1 Tax=Microbacterium timonense TaxID=2086576 RepID=UPI000D0E6F19|nr:DUF11 domain-containing protein [Microbacterium timonense]
MHTRSRIARLLAAGVAVLGLLAGGLVAAAPAYAAESITITPATTTVQSNALANYTVTYSCSTTGGCLNSTITIPTNTVAGNGTSTDFSNWVSAGSCPALSRTAGQVTFSLGTVPTGTYQCTFGVRAPNKTTLNGATVTIAPTFTSSGGSATVPTPAVQTITAGHNAGMGSGVNPTSVLSGATMTLSFSFACGTTNFTGDLGFTALRITDDLPANFTFAGLSTAPVSLPGTLATPAVGTSGGTITYVGDGSECLNPNNNRLVFTVTGTAATNGTPDPVGARICHTATSSFTYIDGFSATASPTPAAPCATVVDLDWRTNKTPGTKTMTNRGQYRAIDNTAPTNYTFPGDWDGAQTTSYEISVNTNPATTNSGLSYDIKDPLPCLDNVSGAKYLSNTPGVVCARPAYIPRVVTVTGFTPAAGATINLLMADGTTRTVPYVAGTGWTLPTAPAVAEIDIPPFAQEGSNNFAAIRFTVTGYAAPDAVPGHVLSNTTSVNAYLSGTTTQVKTTQGQTALILVADPATYGDGALVYGSMSASHIGNCVGRVLIQGSGIEITDAPSKPITLAYLSPEDVGTIAVPPLTVTLNGPNGRVYTATGLSPSSQTVDYNGTGRTLVQWTIPAGLAALPGIYTVNMAAFDVPLGSGCAGTFQNAMTIGYGAPIGFCAVNGANVAPPALAPGDTALDTNGSSIPGNFCGASAQFTVAATGAGFTVDKVVQGNLDPSPIGAGGTGHVSVDGGTATYTVSFSNSGLSTLTDPVMYDLLPRVGDTRASSTAARGSQFPVTLTGINALPADLTVAYSQAVNPCRPEVLTPNAGCVDDWTTTAPASLASVTALRFRYDGNVRVGNSFSASYTVSTPATAAGNIAWNSIGTNVIAGDSLLGKAESSLTGLQAQSAQPAITKTADRTTVDAVGQQVNFTFTVTNNTAVALANVRVSDAIVNSAASSVAPTPVCSSLTSPAGTCSGPSTALAPGQSAVFTATYTVTQADLDHGSVSDQATATASPPTGPSLSNSTGVVTVAATQNGALSLSKRATPGTVDSVGDVIDYSFTVTNTGNVTLRGVAIDETAFSGSGAMSTISCPSGALAPGASTECTATYPVTQADLTAGRIDNTATATATTPAGSPVTSAASTAAVDVEQVSALDLVKSASPSGEAAYVAGQEITYSFVVTNTGNVPVTGITVDEVDFTGTGALSAIDCPTDALAPAAQLTCTATYVLTQEDVDFGSLTNTARAAGTAPGGPVVSEDSTVRTPQVAASDLTLTKTASTGFVNAAGDVVTYTYAVRNTGNVTVHAVTVDETEFTGTGPTPVVTCPETTLSPGQQVLCTAPYTVTQADMDAGEFRNTARASALDPTTASVESPESSATVTANSEPALTVEKTADVTSFDTVGDAVVFSFLVTNTGNVTLTAVTAIERTFTGSGEVGPIDCPADVLAPDESITCTAEYAVTQADIDQGSISNTGEASGETPTGDPVLAAASTVSVAAAQAPGIDFEKTVTPEEADAAGDEVTYVFHVTNTGNVTLTGLTIAETAFSGTGVLGVPDCGATLAPGDDVTCEVTYTLTQPDVDAGEVTNTAVATASAGGAELSSEPSSATLTVARVADLSLVKSADVTDPETIRAGDVVTYSFVATNTGNVTITDARVVEGAFTGTGQLGALDCEPSGPLAPGDQLICAADYTVTQADVDSGELSNTATATGDAPDGVEPPVSEESTALLPAPARPGLALVKTADARQVQQAGQVVAYTFTITNTGNTTARDVSVTEESFSGHGATPVVDCPADMDLVAGQTVECSATYTVVAADLDGAALVNTASATSVAPDGSEVASDPSTARIDDVATAPAPQGSGLAITGGTIAWSAVVLAVGLLLGGGVLLLVRRRRREQGRS